MKTLPKVIVKLGLSATSILVVLLLLEIGLRVKAYWDDRKLFHRAVATDSLPSPEERTFFLRDLIKVHPNPRIIYDLRPDLETVFLNQRITLNRHGFRGREYPLKKAPGTYRILGLGDSYMFGWGVGDDALYLALLEKVLNKYCPQCTWQVINTAVPGYNTVMQVATLKEKGLCFQPDWVLVEFVRNDLDLPNFIRKEQAYFTLTKSFLFTFLFQRGSNNPEEAQDLLREAPRQADEPHQYERDPSKVPAEYRDMVGFKAFVEAMEELKALSQAHKFKVLVFTLFNFPEDIRGALLELAVPMVEGRGRIQQYMNEHHIEKYYGSELSISDKDPHPSPITHRISCAVLFEYLLFHELKPLVGQLPNLQEGLQDGGLGWTENL